MNDATAQTLNTSTLRPGLLVSLKTSVRGNVRYSKEIIEEEHPIDDGASLSRWEQTRTIADAVELAAAKKARSKAQHIIRSVCAQSAFGLLCPEADAEKLAAAVVQAQMVAYEFNRTSRLTWVSVYAITGRIAADDVEAVKAINSEIRDLMSAMETGIANLNVTAVRDAADRAKEISAMLDKEASARVQTAVETARAAARAIKKAGEVTAQEIDTVSIDKIRTMRARFVDLGDVQEIVAPAAPARAVDFAPVE